MMSLFSTVPFNEGEMQVGRYSMWKHSIEYLQTSSGGGGGTGSMLLIAAILTPFTEYQNISLLLKKLRPQSQRFLPF